MEHWRNTILVKRLSLARYVCLSNALECGETANFVAYSYRNCEIICFSQSVCLRVLHSAFRASQKTGTTGAHRLWTTMCRWWGDGRPISSIVNEANHEYKTRYWGIDFIDALSSCLCVCICSAKVNWCRGLEEVLFRRGGLSGYVVLLHRSWAWTSNRL